MEPIFGLYLVDTGWNRQAVLLKLKEVCQLTFPQIKTLLDSTDPVLIKVHSLYDYQLHRILKAFEGLDCRFQVRLIDLGNVSTDFIEEEEYRVYSTFLRTLNRNDNEPTVIYHLTANPSSQENETDFSWLHRDHPQIITEDLVTDFEGKVLSTCRFEARFDNDCPYRFLSDTLLTATSFFVSDHPFFGPDLKIDGKSFDYYNLSRVGFNTNRTRAIVGFSTSVYAMIFCFEKIDTLWVYRDRFSLWVT